MTHPDPPAAAQELAIHQQACSDLHAGRPLQALRAWQHLLTAEPERIRAHLQHVAENLDGDPLVDTKILALKLFDSLLRQEPGENEQGQLGALLLQLGQVSLPELPPQAQLRFEQAWACSRIPEAATALAGFYARQGLVEGAWALGDPAAAPALPPWQPLPCFPGHCQPCQQSLATEERTPISYTELRPIPGGSIWVQRHTNPWHLSHGVGCVDANDAPLLPLCRLYPWPWAPCPHTESIAGASLKRLLHHRASLGGPQRLAGVVLAVADLSAELYFHWLLETLPRLGRAWQHLQATTTPDWVWHNGTNHPRTHEACQRLGIPPERIIHADSHPWIQAETLLVPPFCPFGAADSDQLTWLDSFWADPALPDRAMSPTRHYLPRGLTNRRALLGEPNWIRQWQQYWPDLQLQASGSSCALQLAALSSAELVIAPHGGGMTNLLTMPPHCEVVELVNPAYQPPYFNSLINRGQSRHRLLTGLPTPLPLQELLYEGPSSYPIELDRQTVTNLALT
jgi:hypothetical protein